MSSVTDETAPSLEIAERTSGVGLGPSRAPPAGPRTRSSRWALRAIAALCGIAWASGMRAYMAALTGDGPRAAWVVVLPTSSVATLAIAGAIPHRPVTDRVNGRPRPRRQPTERTVDAS